MVVILARCHPGESPSSYIAQGEMKLKTEIKKVGLMTFIVTREAKIIYYFTQASWTS